MWGRYVDQQIPFVGLGNSAFRRNCLAIARLDGRLRIGNNHYVTLMGNVGYDFVGFNEFAEGEFMSGAGLSYAYNSIFGPLKLQLHWSSITQRVACSSPWSTPAAFPACSASAQRRSIAGPISTARP